jgi:hypothetical protein
MRRNSVAVGMKHWSVMQVAAFMLAVLAVTGCQYDPSTWHYLRTPPSDGDIVGKYVPDAASRKRRIKLPMSDAVLPVDGSAAIILSKNHAAEFVRVPFDVDGRKPCSVTGIGTWSIGQSQGYQHVYIRVRNDERDSPCQGEFGYQMMLYGHKPPFKLHDIIDDPDLGEFVQFEKQQ